MFLKSITLRGFKSFAEKTKLIFEPGVSVIVGPNGSGKSNITDAFLWVMGEQSPTSLRGEKMVDIIFSGGASKKPIGMAEAEVVLDNADGSLGIEFQEVLISRRLYSSGESEYRLNGALCRLLDIQEVLSDTGLGKEMHSVISQGKVEAILSSKPEDRRAVIEEAAGLAKYKKRRVRSIAKLQRVDENLSRLIDIEREVEKQLRPLERQAKQAKRYEEIKSQVDELEIKMLMHEFREYREEHSDSLKKKMEREEAQKGIRKELDALEKMIVELNRQMDDQRSDLESNEAKRNEILRLEERFKGFGQLVSERVGKHKSERDRIGASRGGKDLKDFEIRRLGLENEIADVIEMKGRFEADLAREQETLREMKESGSKMSAETEQERTSLIELERELSELRNRLSFQSQIKSGSEEEISKSRKDIEILERKAVDLKDLKNSAEKHLKEKNKAVGEFEWKLKKYAERMDELSLKLENMRAVASLVQSDISQKEARLQKLERMESESAQSEGLKNLWREIKVEKGFEKAAAAALGVVSEVFVCEKLSLAKDGGAGLRRVGYLKKIKGFVSKLIDLDADLLMNHIKGDPRIMSALQRVIGDVVVVADGDGLAGLSEDVTAVSLNGDLIKNGVFLVTGSLEGDGMMRATESAELREELRALRLKLKTLETTEMERELALIKKETDEEWSKLAVEKRELSSLEMELQQISREIGEASSEIKGVKEYLKVLDEKRKKYEEDLSALEKEITAVQKRIDTGRSKLSDLIASEKEITSQCEELSSTLTTKRVEIAQVSEKLRFLEAEEELLNSQVEECRHALDAGKNEIDRLGKLISMGTKIWDQLDKTLPHISRCLEALELNAGKLRISVEELKEHRDDLEGKRRKLSAESYEAEERLRDQVINSAHLEERLHNFLERISSVAGKSPDEMPLDVEEDFDLEKTSGEFENLKTKLERMGPVNPLAEEELEEVKERKDFVSSQIADLRESCQELRSIIEDLEKRITSVFDETVDKTKRFFAEVIEQLFPGGKGDLEVSEEGIDIRVKIQSKPYKKLSLLSGGEKALVAIAFLFAIFLSKPCPFYILDEVEAALDEINISRFLKMVEKFKDRAQFIVITHQKTTMSIADVLYGVTMRSDGMSKVVAEKIVETV